MWFFCLISAFLVIGLVLLRQNSERVGERKHTMLYRMLSSHHLYVGKTKPTNS